MVLRLFLLLGLVLLGGTGWFIVVQQPPTVQATPQISEMTRLREEGVVPMGDMEENPELEHGVFETPPEDEAYLEEAMANMGSMPGMDMSADGSGMDMASDEGSGMDMASDEGSGMDMASDEGSGMDMASDEGSGMDMASDGGEMTGEEAEAAMAQKMAGLLISDDGAYDREINLSMSEWTFSDLNIEVKEGERIKFTLRNDGNVLHEFMFMTMAQMQAINYRAKRADWSLFEHEALYEKSLLLPEDEITFVAQIAKSGSWMFMCMLPYHMQMGMMGQIATPGAAMKM